MDCSPPNILHHNPAHKCIHLRSYLTKFCRECILFDFFFPQCCLRTIDPLPRLDPQNTELRPHGEMEPECHPPVCDLQPRGLLLLPCFSTHHLWPLGIYLVDSAEVERSLEGCCLCSTVIIESGKHQSQVRE